MKNIYKKLSLYMISLICLNISLSSCTNNKNVFKASLFDKGIYYGYDLRNLEDDSLYILEFEFVDKNIYERDYVVNIDGKNEIHNIILFDNQYFLAFVHNRYKCKLPDHSRLGFS